MIETGKGRLLVIVLLLAVQAALVPMYATQPVNPDAGVFATGERFTENPDEYVGTRVVAEGRVLQTAPTVIRVETSQGVHRLTVVDSSLSPTDGDKLRVYGVLAQPNMVRSIHAFVVPQSGLWYTWGVSFLAGLWVLARLIRHWRLDSTRLCFSPRETPLSVRRLLRGRREAE
jgi:hypothetical protein